MRRRGSNQGCIKFLIPPPPPSIKSVGEENQVVKRGREYNVGREEYNVEIIKHLYRGKYTILKEIYSIHPSLPLSLVLELWKGLVEDLS